jgi:hypothetical protein
MGDLSAGSAVSAFVSCAGGDQFRNCGIGGGCWTTGAGFGVGAAMKDGGAAAEKLDEVAGRWRAPNSTIATSAVIRMRPRPNSRVTSRQIAQSIGSRAFMSSSNRP